MKTMICLILDRSGSMGGRETDVVLGCADNRQHSSTAERFDLDAAGLTQQRRGQMVTRDVVLRTAAFIETHPSKYNFLRMSIPRREDGPAACVLGWLHHFSGVKGAQLRLFGIPIPLVPQLITASPLFGCHDHAFYQALTAAGMNHPHWIHPHWMDGFTWQSDAMAAARCLRRFADRYYPALPRQERLAA